MEENIIITIGILIFPQVEELDFVGPFEVLSYMNKIKPDSTKIMLVAEKAEPLQAFNGLKILPDITLANCPCLDILVVPGGKGRLSAMHNPEIKKFVLRQSECAKYTTSVCTGAFILAEAGLLNGRKATTYHTALSELAMYNTTTVNNAKVVQDGNIITGAGVSSGIELGLYILKLLFGNTLAQEVADKIEYNITINKV